MTCFCPFRMQSLTRFTPTANLNIRPVPWQFPALMNLLSVSTGASGTRSDIAMSARLPSMNAAGWLKSQIGMPAVPHLMSLTARIAGASGGFSMTNPAALLAEVRRAIQSLAAGLLPFSTAAAGLPRAQFANMVSAAHLTLSLRSLGLCPLALANVDFSFHNALGLDEPHMTLNAAIGSATPAMGHITPFALPGMKMDLAMSLAGLAPLAAIPSTLGLPPMGHPRFADMAMGLISSLASMVDLPVSLDGYFDELARLMDLAAIQAAFGEDALTTAGVTRVQTMLGYLSRLRLPLIPDMVVDLHHKLAMLPNMDNVMAGASSVSRFSATFGQAAGFNPLTPAILPLIEGLNVLYAALGDLIDPAASACGGCRFGMGR